MSKSKHHRKPWSEEHQTMLGVTITAALIFAAIFGIAKFVPMKPLPAEASQQPNFHRMETRR